MEIKKTKKNEAKKPDKKCRSCGIDCSRVRGIVLANVPESEKKEQTIKMFGSEKPACTPETCKKR